jgi:hypothetical protein
VWLPVVLSTGGEAYTKFEHLAQCCLELQENLSGETDSSDSPSPQQMRTLNWEELMAAGGGASAWACTHARTHARTHASACSRRRRQHRPTDWRYRLLSVGVAGEGGDDAGAATAAAAAAAASLDDSAVGAAASAAVNELAQLELLSMEEAWETAGLGTCFLAFWQ